MQQLQHTQVGDEALLPTQFISPLFGCFDDMGTCCEVYFCHCVTAGRVKAANEGRPQTVDPLCCFLGCMFPLCTQFTLRGGTRARYNIEGSCPGDFCTVLCCPSCSLCQMANEHNRHGTQTGALCCAPSLAPQVAVRAEMGQMQ